MKTWRFLFIAVIIIFFTSVSKATGIKVIFCSKAYWSENDRKCLDREKGCCIHIEVVALAPGQMPGIISDENGLSLTIPKKTIPQEILNEFFKNGQFYLDGDGTFEPTVLKQLNLPAGFILKSGTYKTIDTGDSFRIFLK